MKKSTFMRSYYRNAYEDPVWELTRRSEECEEADMERSDMQNQFHDALKEKCPELLEQYDDLIDSFLHFENVIFEEFYILGVQDRDDALTRQE